MIIVLLGTQNNDFHRLLDEVEKNIQNGNITDEVIVQAGYTKYNSNNMKIFDMTSKENLERLVADADLVITHAGLGSIEMALKKNKKVIAIPRYKEFGEHVNNHQKDIEEEFNKRGMIIGIESVEKLGEALNFSKQFKPVNYELNNNIKIISIVQNYIDKHK